jgi:hypothetical protein
MSEKKEIKEIKEINDQTEVTFNDGIVSIKTTYGGHHESIFSKKSIEEIMETANQKILK